MKTLEFIGAVVAGAVAGATVALLVAPSKGKDTRSKIACVVGDFCKKHNLKLTCKQISDLSEEVQEAAEEA